MEAYFISDTYKCFTNLALILLRRVLSIDSHFKRDFINQRKKI